MRPSTAPASAQEGPSACFSKLSEIRSREIFTRSDLGVEPMSRTSLGYALLRVGAVASESHADGQVETAPVKQYLYPSVYPYRFIYRRNLYISNGYQL